MRSDIIMVTLDVYQSSISHNSLYLMESVDWKEFSLSFSSYLYGLSKHNASCEYIVNSTFTPYLSSHWSVIVVEASATLSP